MVCNRGRLWNVVERMTWFVLGLPKHNDSRQDQRKGDEHYKNSKNSNVDLVVLDEYQDRRLHLPRRFFLLLLLVFLLQTVGLGRGGMDISFDVDIGIIIFV